VIVSQSFRRRLRCTVIATLAAILLYPISLGPAAYVVFRDATPRTPFADIYRTFYRPLWAAANGLCCAGPLWDYENYCIHLAAHHDGRDIQVMIIPPEPRPDLPE
jgi:hypothetical protein